MFYYAYRVVINTNEYMTDSTQLPNIIKRIEKFSYKTLTNI